MEEIDYKKKYETLQRVLDCSFWISLNINDTFGYACADTEQIEADDIEELMPLLEKYKVHHLLIALASVKRGGGKVAGAKPIRPVMESIGEDSWNNMVSDLLALAKDGTILFTEYWEREGQHEVKLKTPL